ncbi:MAG: TonB-dependent receptor [Sphingorhabdus sp.]|uniref:TonB-dependent receptor n=1 Tax=Sphingorhabdus sp. TaxID=1902408 RepID=UPI00273D613C|nr:TonB-dependent receptor [Sphingorhabdus sp.]MDP4872215.1 TonB-dependent receptor [Sphingorhabdus sp.]
MHLKIQKNRIRSALAVLLTSTAFAVPAWAQEAAGSDSDVIVVTAQKREQNLQDVPIAINAIGNEKLDQLQVSELQDVVKFLPSVTIQQGGPGFAQVYFRGVASGENANHSASLPTVGTYLDEMPITTIQGALDLHAYDLARVEALAGPQGTLYGASSMAGTLKLVTNAPDPSGLYGSAGVEFNNVAHGDFGAIYEGFLNVPIAEGAAARLVGWYRDDAGYIDNVLGARTYASSGITQNNRLLVEENFNNAETYGARLALGIDLDDNWTIKPTFMGQVQNTNGSYAQERSGQTTGELQTVQYNPEGSRDKWIQGALTIEGKIGSWDVTATGGHLRRKTETQLDYSDYAYFYDALSGYGNYFYDNAGVLVNPNQYIQGIDRYKKSFGELRVASPADAPLRFIGGLFAQRQSHNIEQNYIIDNIADSITVTGTNSNIWLTKQKRVDRDYAAFGELTYDLTEKLSLTGGLRYYKFDNSLQGFFGFSGGYSSRTGEAACLNTDGSTRRANPAGKPVPILVDGSPCTNVDKSTSDTGFIHKLNATYKVTDDVLVYATWSRGFRPGGINRRGTLPPYGSDKLDNYELGWKTTFGAFRWNGAVFQEDWNNIQLSFLGANGLTEIRNAGVARIRGLEMDAGFRTGGFSLNAGFSYNDAKSQRDFCKIANATFNCSTAGNELLAPSGSRLPVTAKVKGNAIARYEFPIADWNGHVQFAVNHIGGRRSDLRPVQNAIKGNLDAYTTADVSIGVKKDAWDIEAFATNLFDTRGVVNTGVQCLETVCGTGVTASTPTGGAFYDVLIKPRVIGLKFSRDF